VDTTRSRNLADLRSLQDWRLRYALETVPGVPEVASIGRFVRQYRSLDDLAKVSVGGSGGTPVLLRDLGTVSFGPDLRQRVAEWNGEGETVGGILIMRQGQNALNVSVPELGP
jgi:copper/silver efflux system protein